ncbi:nucleotide exchange factor GrpE [Nonlabens spongiae]|uniref:Protein GrpE n=1 Tax=Nonlabens spongiae TaxID=331648 RepID=A0A1W6MG51_9FLAO|nr:nucleotide exchange factor GrpE [Nonlabens spongiae]ARN76583.1 nucleotide exchange factor GrpE [Nonlabens spongiae]
MAKKDKNTEEKAAQKSAESLENQNTDAAVAEEQADTEQAEKSEKPEQSETEMLEQQVKAEKEKFLRLFAEFENYKRRTAKERVEFFKTAGEGVLKDMLPVLDDFDRAMVEISKSEDEQLATGVGFIANKLRATLKSKGLEEVEVAAGETFDADVHEAVTQIPAPSDDLKGKIVDVVEKGYKLGDKIIRYPKVVIGQ